jgi:hypothetical protein
MSAGDAASVRLADRESFRSAAINATNKIDIGYTTNLVINERPSAGWRLIMVPFFERRCWLILRRELGQPNTAEYACVVLTEDGLDIEVCQYVLIQNDNDYAGRGIDRFQVFFEHAARC